MLCLRNYRPHTGRVVFLIPPGMAACRGGHVTPTRETQSTEAQAHNLKIIITHPPGQLHSRSKQEPHGVSKPASKLMGTIEETIQSASVDTEYMSPRTVQAHCMHLPSSLESKTLPVAESNEPHNPLAIKQARPANPAPGKRGREGHRACGVTAACMQRSQATTAACGSQGSISVGQTLR